jgi:hypothetical protein
MAPQVPIVIKIDPIIARIDPIVIKIERNTPEPPQNLLHTSPFMVASPLVKAAYQRKPGVKAGFFIARAEDARAGQSDLFIFIFQPSIANLHKRIYTKNADTIKSN